ncbi:MAG: hypothetical protein ACPG5M_01130 [Winogradskyella sp.]
MKKNVLKVLALLMVVISFSCSNDDDGGSDNVELTGTWKLTALNAIETYDLNNDGSASINLLNEMNCLTNETLVFSDTNVVTANSTSYVDIYAELETGSTTDYDYTVECESEVYSDPATYVRNGNSVTITIQDDEDEDEVLVGIISGNTFSFVVPESLYIENLDNFDEDIEQDVTYVFTKQ